MKIYSLKHINGNICWLSKEPVEFLNYGNVRFKDGEVSDYQKYLHRKDEPAVEYNNGTKEWWLDGKRHRENGPAEEYDNGQKYWWWQGKYLKDIKTQEEFETWKRFRNFQ